MAGYQFVQRGHAKDDIEYRLFGSFLYCSNALLLNVRREPDNVCLFTLNIASREYIVPNYMACSEQVSLPGMLNKQCHPLRTKVSTPFARFKFQLIGSDFPTVKLFSQFCQFRDVILDLLTVRCALQMGYCQISLFQHSPFLGRYGKLLICVLGLQVVVSLLARTDHTKRRCTQFFSAQSGGQCRWLFDVKY